MDNRDEIQANHELALSEAKAKLARVRSTPPVLTIETTSICNLRCVMCPQSTGGVDRPRHLPPETLARLMPSIRKAVKMQLHGIGEPMASKAFWEALAHIPEGCEASINSNFTLLDEKRLQALVESQLTMINVSLDAARPQSYANIRGFRLETVLGNIRKFQERRAAAGKEFPYLLMNMTLMRSNIEEVVEFVDLAHELKVKGVIFWHLNHWTEPEMARYRMERNGWFFDYSKEGLWNHKALSNRMLRRAVARGEEIGLQVTIENGGKATFFEDVVEEEEVLAR